MALLVLEGRVPLKLKLVSIIKFGTRLCGWDTDVKA